MTDIAESYCGHHVNGGAIPAEPREAIPGFGPIAVGLEGPAYTVGGPQLMSCSVSCVDPRFGAAWEADRLNNRIPVLTFDAENPDNAS
jgi:hypothetical protein